MTLKELNLSFMLLGGFPCGKCPQVAPLAGFGILLAGIQAVLSRLEFANHNNCPQHVDRRTCLARRGNMEFPLLGQTCVGSVAGMDLGPQGREMRSVQTSDIARLDQLLNELGNETEAQCEVLREHLEGARVYLVGLMPAEYALSLKMAEEALNCVSDRNLRKRIEDFIKGT